MGRLAAFCHLKSLPAPGTSSLSLTCMLPLRCLSPSLPSKVVKAGVPAEATNWQGQVSLRPLQSPWALGPPTGRAVCLGLDRNKASGNFRTTPPIVGEGEGKGPDAAH